MKKLRMWVDGLRARFAPTLQRWAEGLRAWLERHPTIESWAENLHERYRKRRVLTLTLVNSFMLFLCTCLIMGLFSSQEHPPVEASGHEAAAQERSETRAERSRQRRASRRARRHTAEPTQRTRQRARRPVRRSADRDG